MNLSEKIGKFLDAKLGNHKPIKDSEQLDQFGFQNSAKCRYCGKRILQDSNGDWFASAIQEVPT